MKWEQLKNASLPRVIEWAETQPWCQAMSQCQQDAQWHAEGDVWTHTRMVLCELTDLQDWPTLTSQQQNVLIFTALMHDVAKPLTTAVDPQTGHIRSPKHAVKGEHIARQVLRDLECDLHTREEIARLVRFHGRPAFLAERADPAHEVAKLSWLVNNRLLYLFALADTRGRTTASMKRPEEDLHFWKLQAEELGCFETPYSFATPHARYTFFHHPEPNLHYTPHEAFSCKVTLMAGLPGAGKDTWIAANRGDLPVIALDDIRRELKVQPTEDQGRVAQLAYERCRELLRQGTSFVHNATSTMRTTRSRWLKLFAQYNAGIEIVYIEPQFETLLRQNKQRQSPVPEKVLRKLAGRCEPPTWLECHHLTITAGSDA